MLENDVQAWIDQDPDPETQSALKALLSHADTAQLQNLFRSRAAFGTAGIRAPMGPGPMQINRLFMQQTAAGIAQYLKDCFSEDLDAGVMIGYDGRKNSAQFAQDMAMVLTAQQIKVFLIHKATPTPLVPFGIQHYNCLAGIMITASHNTANYNGLKLYWQHGGQIDPGHIDKIQDAITEVAKAPISTITLEEATQQQRLVHLDDAFLNIYLEHLYAMPFLQHTQFSEEVSIAYTALHGVGGALTEQLLKHFNVTQVHLVTSQHQPDGAFPTVEEPNPENPDAMIEVVQLAKQHGCLLAIAHDPDADRFCVAVRDQHDKYRILSGDQVGCLIADYLLQRPYQQQQLVGNTLVSSSMLKKL